MKTASWFTHYKQLYQSCAHFINGDMVQKVKLLYREADLPDSYNYKISQAMQIAHIAISELGLGNSATMAVLLFPLVKDKRYQGDIATEFNVEVATIVRGLERIKQLYAKTPSLDTENFRKLLLTLAEDVRVIMIMLADRLHTMRHLLQKPAEKRQYIARETAFLYAPMAHRMGLYKVKTEMEDLSMKYTVPEIYKEIAHKLSETKRERDKYIEQFIEPLRQKLAHAGLTFTIKGRTKSIYSIWNKIKKQNTTFEGIYDLFAIRVILDSPIDKEKAECWQVYSIVADMYTPNPKRLRDWLSNPKANGYESLHTTVMGPEGKWVEVQIRTNRMDEVAEKGVAAHWKYKGVQGETTMDQWLKNLREVLENPELSNNEYMDEFKLNLYDEEVFVFTPNGDLHKLPKGATLLDFAFAIHTHVGSTCIGGKIGGKNVTLRYVLNNGDQIEVITSPNQKPRRDWMNIVVTSKAKQKIRQVIKETETKQANAGREILLRRFKNWKIELDESRLSRLAKKMGYKNLSDLYIEIANEEIEVLDFRDKYLDFDKKEEPYTAPPKADEYTGRGPKHEDILIINNETKGVQYTMAKCCNPIFGDEIFGFVSVSGGIKIHRKDCPNAPQMISRFGYRIVKAAWEASSGQQHICTLYVTGNDDLGIVTNISSLLSKEKSVTLRSISINSDAGIFEGRLVVTVTDTQELDRIIHKIRTVKGVQSVARL
ncbi:MAG: bifunctional (p)ppGpp synthetase/guanosine-3',5'-bis(diphosphate) 3'-pyrophosphohydrolase [Paludibacteraceae bacterium]|nr:bifunctional (p)ppGpp synthetase/guanosine-3',5'-bis(diphosphate) 3'-pyrophosphohydrolase [Paludibacteraceae bacterium]